MCIRDRDKIILSVDFTDYTGSNTLKIFDDVKKKDDYDKLKKGTCIFVQGEASFDKYANDVTIRPNSIMTVKKEMCIRDSYKDQSGKLLDGVFVRFDHFLNHLTADRTSLFRS